MSTEDKVGVKALSDKWKKISAYAFEIIENIIIEFQDSSCNITDSDGNLIEALGEKYGRITRDILASYRCYVIKIRIKFGKKST